MIKCVMIDDQVRFFSNHVVHSVTHNEDDELIIVFQNPEGQTIRARIKEFMVAKTGVWLK